MVRPVGDVQPEAPVPGAAPARGQPSQAIDVTQIAVASVLGATRGLTPHKPIKHIEGEEPPSQPLIERAVMDAKGRQISNITGVALGDAALQLGEKGIARDLCKLKDHPQLAQACDCLAELGGGKGEGIKARSLEMQECIQNGDQQGLALLLPPAKTLATMLEGMFSRPEVRTQFEEFMRGG